MKLSAILAPLIAAGVSGDVILATVKAFEEQQSDALERRRQSDRERQARRRSHVTSRDVTVTVPSRARVEDISSTSQTSGEDKKQLSNAQKARVVDLDEFKAEFPDLDSERLEAIIKHRRTKRGQLTGLAARLFRQDATACGLSISDAVDTCISRNWLTVKPDYLAGKQQHRSGAPPPTTHAESVNATLDRIINGKSHEHPTIDAGFERGDSRGAEIPLRLIASASRN